MADLVGAVDQDTTSTSFMLWTFAPLRLGSSGDHRVWCLRSEGAVRRSSQAHTSCCVQCLVNPRSALVDQNFDGVLI
jgi:hypothetical protein